MLKYMVMSRKAGEQGVTADQWRPQQNAGIYGATYFSGLFHFSCPLQLSLLLQSITAGTHSKDSRLCKYLSIYSNRNKLIIISFGQNFYF